MKDLSSVVKVRIRETGDTIESFHFFSILPTNKRDLGAEHSPTFFHRQLRLRGSNAKAPSTAFDPRAVVWRPLRERLNDNCNANTFFARFFAWLFSRLFNHSYFHNLYQVKIFTITYVCRPMGHYCAYLHSTSSTRWPNGSIFSQHQFFYSIFLTKIKLPSASFDSTRLTQQGGQTARSFVELKIKWKIEPFG